MAQRTEKVAESVAREIVQDIRRNNLVPGSTLPPESAMLERFGVGRGSLREALRILEVNGLVVLKPGPRGGPVVAPFDPAHFGQMMTLHLQALGTTYRQLLDARVEYEAVLARMAAEREGEEAGAIMRAAMTGDPGMRATTPCTPRRPVVSTARWASPPATRCSPSPRTRSTRSGRCG